LTNSAKELERANVTIEKPGILSLDECRALLRAAPPDFVPAIAIGLFAGLRPEAELWPLDWRSIDLKERLIDVSVSKNSASHRLSKSLTTWPPGWNALKRIPARLLREGTLTIPGSRKRAHALRERCARPENCVLHSMTGPRMRCATPSLRCTMRLSSTLPRLPNRWATLTHGFSSDSIKTEQKNPKHLPFGI
jgi:hypothetical protein